MPIVVNAQIWMPKNTTAESAEVCRARRSLLLFAIRFQRSDVKPGALELINCVFGGSRPAAGMAGALSRSKKLNRSGRGDESLQLQG